MLIQALVGVRLAHILGQLAQALYQTLDGALQQLQRLARARGLQAVLRLAERAHRQDDPCWPPIKYLQITKINENILRMAQRIIKI